MTEIEQAVVDDLKKKTALLLEEKAAREEKLIEKIISKLESIEKEVHIVRSSTTELPQIRANQESQGTRIRTLEDRWIIIVAVWIMTTVGFAFYLKWKLP